jgi:hypothetical protein
MAVSQQRCEGCEHAERDRLDVLLARGVSLEMVSQEFGVKTVVLDWHRDRHLKGIPKAVTTDPQGLLEDLEYAKRRAEAAIQWGLENSKPQISLAGIREFRECVVVMARLMHAEDALDPRKFIPFYRELCARIMGVVEELPEEQREKMIKALAIEDGTKK